jgi:hypothetical protein
MRRYAALYGGGAVAGSLLTATVLAALGSLLGRVLPAASAAVLGGLAGGLIIVERLLVASGTHRGLLPENRRLIPRSTLLEHGGPGVVSFGFQMGLGWKAYVPVAGPYLVAIFVVQSPPTLLSIGALSLGFGLGRTLPLLVGALTTGLSARRTRLVLAERASRPWPGFVLALGTAACLLASEVTM